MSRIQKITCDECGNECEISFEISNRHESYWMNVEGIITTGTNSIYDGKLVKNSFNQNDLEEIMCECEECGNSGATLYLDDETVISDDELDNATLWSIL